MRCALLSALIPAIFTAATAAQSTAFTYQGRLKNGNQLANGLHDLRFTLFNALSGGVVVAGPQCTDNVIVTDGLFTVTLDFGAQFATTTSRFIQIEVRTDTGLGCGNLTGFTVLSPRQVVTGAPRAVHANTASSLDAPDGSPVSAVLVDNAGNVGVGIGAPAVPLHIARDADPVLVLQDIGPASSQAGYVGFWNGASVETGWVGFGSPSNPHFSIVNTRPLGNIGFVTEFGERVTIMPSGNVGLGTTTPQVRLDVRGNIRLGPAGEFYAPGGHERLLLLRGSIDGSGSTDAGDGFTCVRQAEGVYRITFDVPFTSIPSVTVSAIQPFNQAPRWATFVQSTSNASSVDIFVMTGSSSTTDSDFHFCIIGPR